MSTPLNPPPLSTDPAFSPQPQRHGCVTAWLVFVMVVNSLAALGTATPPAIAAMANQGLHPSVLALGGLIICALANIAFAVALLNWQKWGFYGVVVASFIALGINLSIGTPILSSLLGLVGIAVLYGVLQIGGVNKAWPRLR